MGGLRFDRLVSWWAIADVSDDGAILKLRIDIRDDGSATFDYTGTSMECLNNINAPLAITRSTIIYSLRALIGVDIPLNAGVLAPIKLIVPENSLLCPSDDAAVSCGNTETSQRATDMIFKAFEACAASQGCMNYTAFDYGKHYYAETICGGAGAGHNWKGQSAVHVNVSATKS